MIRRPPGSTRTDTPIPSTTRFRSAVAVQPSQCSRDDPAARKNHEAFCNIGSLDDLDSPFADTPERFPELVASIAAIGKDMAQPWKAVDDFTQDQRRAVRPEERRVGKERVSTCRCRLLT